LNSSKSSKALTHATAHDVQRWLREAWPGHETYPNPKRCKQLAIRVNVIVDRHNARSKNDSAANAAKQRRQDMLAAQKHARALERSLPAMLEDLRLEGQMMVMANAEKWLGETWQRESAAIENLRSSLAKFLKIFVPIGLQDHADPVLWLARAVGDAWSDMRVKGAKGQEKIVRFGRKPDSPLVHFIRLAFEGIGLAGDERDGYSPDTISDHLRSRQNRPRKR
jgi:hypothetical protein